MYACVQICVYWRWDRSDNEASWRLFSSSRRSLEINGPQTHGDKTSSTHLLSERHPNLLTPRRRRLLMRLCREQIHLRSVCRSSPSLPSCPDSTEVSNSKGSRCKKRPDPLYPQTKPPKPSKSSEALH